MLRGRSSTGAQAPRACQTQGWGFRRKAPSLMAAGNLGSPCLLLGNRIVRVRDPQAVAHTSCHTRCQVYRHTHTPQQTSPNTETCYLTDYSEAPIPPGSSDSPGGKAVRRRIPQSTTQDSRRYAPWELTILTHRNMSHLLIHSSSHLYQVCMDLA